jgi:hypothetical protein
VVPQEEEAAARFIEAFHVALEAHLQQLAASNAASNRSGTAFGAANGVF